MSATTAPDVIDYLVALMHANAPEGTTVIDGHPATLGWLGSVAGHRVRSLGVDRFGQAGSIPELYREYGIDRSAIMAAAAAIAPGRPLRHTGWQRA